LRNYQIHELGRIIHEKWSSIRQPRHCMRKAETVNRLEHHVEFMRKQLLFFGVGDSAEFLLFKAGRVLRRCRSCSFSRSCCRCWWVHDDVGLISAELLFLLGVFNWYWKGYIKVMMQWSDCVVWGAFFASAQS
jgi:hypothetical protein